MTQINAKPIGYTIMGVGYLIRSRVNYNMTLISTTPLKDTLITLSRFMFEKFSFALYGQF